MRKLSLILLFLALGCTGLEAQTGVNANLTAADAGTCATANACLVLRIPQNVGGATFTITTNASGNTVQFEASGDNQATWVALNVTPSNATTAVTSTTGTGTWQANVAGYTHARMRISNLVGGSTASSINPSTASARAGGGGGLPTGCTSPGTGAITCTGTVAANALTSTTSLSTGSGASAAGATATGGFACVEGASTGWTPTVGQDYIRCDSTLHSLVSSSNGVAEALLGSAALSGLTAATASNTIANGNNPQTWNWAQTTDSQSGITFGETSAATNGTLTNGLPNQANATFLSGANSTASPVKIVQGQITNTVATPGLPVTCSWNNASLIGKCLLVNITNTASDSRSLAADVRVNNTSQFGVDANTGLALFEGSGSLTLIPAPAAIPNNVNGWKSCGKTQIGCWGVGDFAGFDLLGNGAGGNNWFNFADAAASAFSNNATAARPDSAAGFAFSSSGAAEIEESTCSNITNLSGKIVFCPDSTAHEVLVATAGASNATPGMLVRTQPGAIHVIAQTATKTIYTLCAASPGACNVAGQYRITWYFNQTGTPCGTPTPGQVTFEISYTDSAGAHSAVALPMNDNSSIAVFTNAFKFGASNTASFASGEFNIWSTGAQPIQVTNTMTACGVGSAETWELTATVERVR